MRWRLLIAALLASPALGACAADHPATLPDLISVTARPLQAQKGQRIGRTTLVEAFELRAADPRFGGFSGMAVTERRFYLLSDRGWLWWAERSTDRSESVPAEWRVVELIARGRRPDAEELTVTGDGQLAIAIEGAEALAIIPGPEKPREVEVRNLPAAFRRQPTINEGIEGLTTLADGSLLAISEGQTLGEECYLVMQLAKATSRTSCYPAAKGFHPTGAARAGDRLLVIERLFALFRFETRITSTALSGDLVPRLEASEIARIDGNGLTENYEAIAVDGRSPPTGPYELWIVSDDNFNALQQTKLLHLRWNP